MHNEDELEEDDDFLSVGSEFLEAVRNSQMAMECIPIDDRDLG